MARPKTPDWKKMVNKQAAEHNKALAQEFNRQRLTKWVYHNGEVVLVYVRHRGIGKYIYSYRWIPKKPKPVDVASQDV